MPTILSDKAFQAHYRELSKQLKNEPGTLNTDHLIQDIKDHMKLPVPSPRKLLGWRSQWKELKGAEIFTQFTSLFLETHLVNSTQAQELRSIFETVGSSASSRTLSKVLNAQLIVNETLDQVGDTSSSQVMRQFLNQRIANLQDDTKTVMKAKEKLGKIENISRIISRGMITVGVGSIFSSAILAMSVVSIPASIVLFTAGAILSILSLIPLGIQIYSGSEKDNKEKVIYQNTQEIERMMDFYKKMHESDVMRFLEELNPSDSATLSKNENLIPIIDLYENEGEFREIQNKIIELERESPTGSTNSTSEKEKAITALRAKMDSHLAEIKKLRDQLNLPPFVVSVAH